MNTTDFNYKKYYIYAYNNKFENLKKYNLEKYKFLKTDS